MKLDTALPLAASQSSDGPWIAGPIARRAPRRALRASAAGAIAIASLSLGGNALAAPPTPPKGGPAQQLVKEAKQLMAGGKYAKACPKLAESQTLAPQTSTLFDLAACHIKEGKIATAWKELDAVVELARAAADEALERKALAAQSPLASKLSHLTLHVPPGSESNGLEVTIDGTPVDKKAWGTAVRIDPGTHEVAATIPDRQSWMSSVVVGKKPEEKTVDIPPAPASLAGATSPAPGAKSQAKIEDPDYPGQQAEKEKAEDAPRQPKPVLGFVLAGAGIVSIGVGAYFGIHAISLRTDSDGYCGPLGCSQKGVDLNDQAKTAAWISDFGIGLGVVALGVGGYLLFKPAPAASKPEETQAALKLRVRVVPQVTATSAGVGVGGAW